MACGIVYKDAVLITTLVNINTEGMWDLVPNVPFKIFGYDAVRNRENLNNENRAEFVGLEVIAKVDYRVVDERKVKEFAGYLGDKFDDIKLQIKYLEFAEIRKADYLACIDSKTGTVIKYAEADAQDIVPFCKFVDVVDKPELFIGKISTTPIDGESQPKVVNK